VSFRLLYNKILTSKTIIFECISWLINVTDINDSRWKPEINFAMLVGFVISLLFVCFPGVTTHSGFEFYSPLAGL
jgi:hypothetical protein